MKIMTIYIKKIKKYFRSSKRSCLNDNTIEGIRVKDKKAFSVQYHPEAAPGPHDSRYLFDDFITMMK